MSAFDFENVEAWEPHRGTMLTPGEYVVRITNTDTERAQSSGNLQLLLWLENDQGSIRDWIAVTQANMAKVVAPFVRAGIALTNQDWNATEGEFQPGVIDRLVGKQVGIVVREESDVYQGQTRVRTRVVGYLAPKQITGEGNGQVSGASGAEPAQPAQQPPGATATASADERIPF